MSYDTIARNGETIKRWYTTADKAAVLADWREERQDSAPDLMQELHPPPSDAAALPPYSLLLILPFTLAKPYLSKDDRAFHPLDSPLRREWVYNVPMIAAASWKGALRQALRFRGHGDSDPVIVRLFGPVKEALRAGAEGQAGALYFYPTFFQPDQAGLELINPHDRESGKGTNPILMECVKVGATGVLTLVHAPPGAPGPAALATDLPVLVEGLIALLLIYGVGAKTSAGYGVTGGRFTGGKMVLNVPMAAELPPFLVAPDRLIDLLRSKQGTLVDYNTYQRRLKERGRYYNASYAQLYQQAAAWSRDEQPAGMPLELPEATFGNPKTLRDAAAQLVEQLNPGGAP